MRALQPPSRALRTRVGRESLVLAVLATAQLVVALDATIMNVALPSAQESLGFAEDDRAWVVTAYTLSFAGLLLVGGRLVDRFGQRRALQAALIGFAAASALAGLAPGLIVLLIGRALQGMFAAVLSPAALSAIGSTFTDPRARGRAFAVYGAVASSGGVVGLLLGGLLTQTVGWRWCLYVNVVVCAAVLLIGRRLLPRGRSRSRARLDVGSGFLATAALGAIVLGCSRAAEVGWTAWSVVVALLVGSSLGGGFLVRQRGASSPLLPLWLLRDRVRISAYIAAAAGVVGMFGTFLVLTYYYQRVLGFSPLRTGVAFLPMTLAVAASSYGVASRLTRLRPHAIVVPGLLVSAGALALLATLDTSSDYLTVMLPAELAIGAGMGCVFTPAISAATAGVDPRYAGVAAASVNVAMQMGASVGTAAINTVVIHAATASAHSGAGAQVDGYTTATVSGAIVLVVAGMLVALLTPGLLTMRREKNQWT